MARNQPPRGVRPGVPLPQRYPGEEARAWQALYEREPELYDRLIAGERIHPAILDWIPPALGTVVEVGAGTGRLTCALASRCARLVAVEPAVSMRRRLVARLAGLPGRVTVCAGDTHALPFRDRGCDAVVSCATLSPDPTPWGGERALRELERVCARGGMIVLVWPHTPSWLQAHGYEHVVFEGEMAHEFASAREAVDLARVFYPERVADVAALRSRVVPYEVLGVNAPRDLAWKRVT